MKYTGALRTIDIIRRWFCLPAHQAEAEEIPDTPRRYDIEFFQLLENSVPRSALRHGEIWWRLVYQRSRYLMLIRGCLTSEISRV